VVGGGGVGNNRTIHGSTKQIFSFINGTSKEQNTFGLYKG
jgi:hypothetical protein